MLRSSLTTLLSMALVGVSSSYALAQVRTDAKQAIIVDHDSGIVLYEKDARAPMPPASMTKIMTAFMVFEALERGEITEETTFTVSEDAWRRGGVSSGSSTMFLKVNSEVPVIDLLRGLIIQSGNDACIVLAEGLAGSEQAFARRMTQRAKEMGLESATFLNTTGWPDEGHEISAADLATLSRELIERFPEYYALYSERAYEWNGIRQQNRNPLLGSLNGADGVKTGSTSVSGFGLVGSAKRGDARRTIVINGLDSASERRRVAMELMETAFGDFSVLDMYDSGTDMGAVPVYMGKAESVAVVLRDDVNLAHHTTERRTIKARIDYKVAAAPVEAGDVVGELVVSKAGEDVARYPLYAAASVERKGFFGRIGAAVVRMIRG